MRLATTASQHSTRSRSARVPVAPGRGGAERNEGENNMSQKWICDVCGKEIPLKERVTISVRIETFVENSGDEVDFDFDIHAKHVGAIQKAIVAQFPKNDL